MYDHRKIGRELGLFDSDPLIGAGLPYWLPAGAAVRRALESYIAEVERRAGYQQVYSPVLAKKELYEISNGPCYAWKRRMSGDPCMLSNLARKKRFRGIEADLSRRLVQLRREN